MRKIKSRWMGYTITFTSEKPFEEVEQEINEALARMADRNSIEFVRCLSRKEIQDERQEFFEPKP